MECLWCVYRHWPAAGHCHQQDPPVFYVHFPFDNGLPHYYLYGAGFLEKYAEVYLGGKEESMVLFITFG